MLSKQTHIKAFPWASKSSKYHIRYPSYPLPVVCSEKQLVGASASTITLQRAVPSFQKPKNGTSIVTSRVLTCLLGSTLYALLLSSTFNSYLLRSTAWNMLEPDLRLLTLGPDFNN